MLELSNESLLYRLYRVYGGGDRSRPDLCHFIRRLFLGSLYILCIVGIATAILYSIFDFGLTVTLWLKTGLWINPTEFSQFIIVVLASTLVALLVLATLGITIMGKEAVEDSKIGGFLKEVYKSFKDKYCPIIYIK